MRFFRWRKMTWLILVFSAAMLAWVVAAASSVAETAVTSEDRSDCQGLVDAGLYDSVGECIDTLEAAADVGAGIGTGILILLWVVGFIVLSLIWLMTRPRRRMCPRCGNDVKRGHTDCPACGYAFGRPQPGAQA